MNFKRNSKRLSISRETLRGYEFQEKLEKAMNFNRNSKML